MAQSFPLEPDRPVADQTRTELTLARIGRAWSAAPLGREFTQALLDFLRSLASPSTLRSYSFSILEFFDWFQRRSGRIPTPAQVRRADAAEYAAWLRTRARGLQKWHLEKDPDRRLSLAIFNVVAARPGSGIDHIRGELLRLPGFATYSPFGRVLTVDHPDHVAKTGGLGKKLACLARVRTLKRTPSVAELRRGDPPLELEFADGRPVPFNQLGLTVPIPDDVFSYFPPEVTTPEGADRASTMATRLSALSSFWARLTDNGENTGSGEPLLRHNIWTAQLKDAARKAPSHQAAARARTTPSFELFLRLLATTFYRSHGAGPPALAAAKAVFWGKPEPPRLKEPSFGDLRDRALLVFMVQTGVRAKELSVLTRGDVTGSPPVVSVLGKRGKRRVLRVPPPAALTLGELFRKIRHRAGGESERGDRAKALLEPTAPLLPAVAYWGANDWKATETGLTRPGIAMVLRRRAQKAGIPAGSPEFARAHPHGLRHLFAKVAADTGTGIHRIQAMMGHSSAATTGRYMEERDPEKLVVEAFVRESEAAADVPEGLPDLPPSRTEGVPSITPPSPARRRSREEPRAPELSRPLPPPALTFGAGETGLPDVMDTVVVMEEIESPPARRLQAPSPSTTRLEDTEWIAQARGEPLSEKEKAAAQAKCAGISDSSLRNMCLIYLLHWGEKGNVQALKKSGGRPTAQESARRRSSEDFVGNVEEEWGDEDWEDEEDDWAPSELEDLEEGEGAIEVDEREFALVASDVAGRIFTGKESGLAWFYGPSGRLRPQMPLLSPRQVGACSSERKDEICRGLISLWREWFTEDTERAAGGATKSDALVAWIGEALDASRQLEAVVKERGAQWVAPAADWKDTRYRGRKASPSPRMVFREHLEKQILNWFRAVAWRHPGPKVLARDQVAEPWHTMEDPFSDLPRAERVEAEDWITSLAGGIPRSTERIFPASGGYSASRAQVARVLSSFCSFGGRLDEYRGRSAGPWKVATYLNSRDRSKVPSEVATAFAPYEEAARKAVDEATGGGEREFDLRAAYKARPERSRQKKFMAIVLDLFGERAFNDSALRNVARCGDTALAGFGPMFTYSEGTIRHDEDFKRGFADEYGTHSECVARRIARELWEMKKRAPSRADRPREVKTAAEVARLYKIPCTPRQEVELKSLVRRAEEPGGIFRAWHEGRPSLSPAQSRTEVQEMFAEMGEETRVASHADFARKVFTPNPRKMTFQLPSPIHFVLAVRN